MKYLPKTDWEGALRELARAEATEARLMKIGGEGQVSAGMTRAMYGSSMKILAANRRWREALSVLARMQAGGKTPDAQCVSAAITACSTEEQCDIALKLLRKAQRSGWKVNHYSYLAAISACGKSGNGEEAMALFREMSSAGIALTARAYEVAMKGMNCLHPGQYIVNRCNSIYFYRVQYSSVASGYQIMFKLWNYHFLFHYSQ